MQQPTISTPDPLVTTSPDERPLPKPYHAPSFTRLGKVVQLTGQTTRPTTTRPVTVNKNGRAS